MLFGMVSFMYLGIMGIICAGIMQIPPIRKRIDAYINSLEEFED